MRGRPARALLLAVGLGAPPAAAQVSGQVSGVPELPPDAPVELLLDGLVGDFEAYHSACRGGSGDQPETWAACGARDYAGYLLGRLGWCLGEADAWQPCAEGGSRLGRP